MATDLTSNQPVQPENEIDLIEVVKKLWTKRKFIIKVGSVFYAAGDIADVVAEAFPNHFEEEHSFQEDILSRKNQIVPLLSRAIINSVH